MSETALSDNELIAQAKSGQQTAWDELLRRFTPMLWRFAKTTHTRNLTDEDLVQEAWILFRWSVQQFDPSKPAAFLSWCYATIPRRLQNIADESGLVRTPVRRKTDSENQRRKKQRSLRPVWSIHTPIGARLKTTVADLIEDDTDVPAEACRRDQCERLARAIERLPDQQREVMQMRMLGMELKKISAVYGFSHQRVNQILAMGMEPVRLALKGKWA